MLKWRIPALRPTPPLFHIFIQINRFFFQFLTRHLHIHTAPRPIKLRFILNFPDIYSQLHQYISISFKKRFIEIFEKSLSDQSSGKHAVAMVTRLTMTTALSNAGRYYLIVKDQVDVDPRKWKPLRRSLFHSAQVCTQQFAAVAGSIRSGITKRAAHPLKPRLLFMCPLQQFQAVETIPTDYIVRK